MRHIDRGHTVMRLGASTKDHDLQAPTLSGISHVTLKLWIRKGKNVSDLEKPEYIQKGKEVGEVGLKSRFWGRLQYTPPSSDWLPHVGEEELRI
jgi:hypothetical protein